MIVIYIVLISIFLQLEQEEDGMTPLQIACHKGHEKVVKYLLEVKVDVNKADSDGNTPLHFALHG